MCVCFVIVCSTAIYGIVALDEFLAVLRVFKLAEYANSLPGLELFFVNVHKGSHFFGGTTPGCNFVHNIAPYILYAFVGYVSSRSDVTTPIQSLPAECSPLEDGDDKDVLRRAVEGLFNSLYGGNNVCANSVQRGSVICIQGEEQRDKRLTGSKSISVYTYSSHQQTTEVQQTTEIQQTSEAQQTTEEQQTTVVKPKPGQNVNIISTNSHVVGTGKVMEGNMLHGHKIPDSFVNIAIQRIDSNIPPLLKTTSDEPYLAAGGFTA